MKKKSPMNLPPMPKPEMKMPMAKPKAMPMRKARAKVEEPKKWEKKKK